MSSEPDAAITRGTCSVCRYRVQLRKNGSIGGHLIYGAGYGGQGKPCEGAGLWPSGTTSRGKR